MSTRCQIGFYKERPKNLNKFEALIYRHSDGYPEGESGVLEAIVPFLKWFKAERGLNDVEYASARLLQDLCNRYDNHSMEFDRKINNIAKARSPFTGLLGHGISKDFHGDIEFFYAVYPEGVSTYEVEWDKNGAKEPKEWKEIMFSPLD